MNESYEQLTGAGISMAAPKTEDFRVVATSRSVYAPKSANSDYNERVDRIVSVFVRDVHSMQNELLERQEALSLRIYDNLRISKLFHAMKNVKGQHHLETFQQFQSADDFFAFDIETMGDTQDRVRPYSPTEIALNRYNRNNELIEVGMNRVIAPTQEVADMLTKSIEDISADRYYYNSLPEWQKRSLVDLMRYSGVAGEGIQPFELTDDGFSHNTIIEQIFNDEDKVSHAKVVQSMEQYIPHMKAGLKNMMEGGIAISYEQAYDEFSQIVRNNPDAFFVSYNGEAFDTKILKAFSDLKGTPIDMPQNHLDMLNLIRMVETDPDRLHEALNPDGSYGSLGKTKLAAFLSTLEGEAGESQEGVRHNSIVDTTNTAKVTNALTPILSERIEEAKADKVPKRFEFHPTEFTWTDEELEQGAQLYSNRAIQAKGDFADSFILGKDADGNPVRVSSEYNGGARVIRPKTFYQYQGAIQIETERGLQTGVTFFDPEREELAVLLHHGDDSDNVLRTVVQQHFYNWEKVNRRLKRNIEHDYKSDLARRQYDRMFSFEGAGKGLVYKNGELVERGTNGFVAARRMYNNAKVMEEYLQGQGKYYAQQLDELVALGMSKNQARKELRRINTHNLLSNMDFNSMWDGEKWVFNEEEKNKFFKMYGRLIDELPYYDEAIEKIEQQYTGEINRVIASGKDEDEINKQLREINKKRDEALIRYHQSIQKTVGSPEKVQRRHPFDKQIMSYYDAELDDYRTFNFETPQKAQSDFWSYIKQGVGEGENRKYVLQERLDNLLKTMHSQRLIDADQFEEFTKIMRNTDSAWDSAGLIAARMRDAGVKSMRQMIADVSQNQNIAGLSQDTNRMLVNQSLSETINSVLDITPNAQEGEKIRLSSQLEQMLEVLDERHLSGLDPKNRKAVEMLLAHVNQYHPEKSISLSLNAENDVLRLHMYNGKDSVSVRNQLERNKIPTNALQVDLPLITRAGTHRVNGLILNAHTVAALDGKTVVQRSTTEMIAQGYIDRMKTVMNAFNKGEVEEANRLVRKALRDTTESYSGIQREAHSANDSYRFAENVSDFGKQTHVRMGNALVEDLFYNGYNGVTLTKDDFYEDVIYQDNSGQPRLKRGVNLESVKMQKKYELLQLMPDWAADRMGEDGQKFYMSFVKDAHITDGVLSQRDMRPFRPFGHYYEHGRGNLIQFLNLHEFGEGVEQKLKKVKGITLEPLLRTDDMLELEQVTGKTMPTFNANVAYMTQQQWQDSIQDLQQTDKGRKLLSELNLLRDNGEVDWMKMPRLYEQQVIVADDLYDALEFNGVKRYQTGSQFSANKDLKIGDTIKPGTLLGIRTHDNGYRERVMYEENKLGVIKAGIQDGQDLLVQWSEKPHKLVFDGEKGTDSLAARKLITAVTGDESIAAIINPDVKKHKDFGMLMSGEARALAYKVNHGSASKKAQQSLIQMIEGYGVGLEWDAERKMFRDISATAGEGGKPLEIPTNRFDQLFEDLKMTHLVQTSKGVRKGILEVGMAGVSNYSKVIDGTGHQVLWHEDELFGPANKVYGQVDGVTFGHREMGVFKRRGMEETYKYVFSHMMDQANESGKDVHRFREAYNILHSFEKMTKDPAADEPIFKVGNEHFRPLPEQFRNKTTYRGTIFDREALQARGAGESGFWLELDNLIHPDGKKQSITVNVDGDPNNRKAINKIFLPFTNLEGANGEVHLRELQKHKSNIYRKAAELQNAKDYTEAQDAFKNLQGAVDRYYENAYYDLTSSKGLLGEGGLKAKMGTSASGVYKVMDPHLSMKFQEEHGKGEYTLISEADAKKMGVYDQLKSGKKMFTANVRFPTFHNSAIQFNRIMMHESVKEGEFHTTSFAAMLHNADSDGDYGHTVVVNDDKVQAEWEAAHARAEKEFEFRTGKYDDLLKEHAMLEVGDEAGKEARKFKSTPDLAVGKAKSLDDLTDWERANYEVTGKNADGELLLKAKNMPHGPINTRQEMAAKIGKMTIGQASNLNLAIHQLADTYLPESDPNKYKLLEFGRGLEQKLIDAKHGAKPAGLMMIKAIHEGNWNEALEIDKNEFDGRFTNEFHMGYAAEQLPQLVGKQSKGFHTQGLKFGTSTGLDSRNGLEYLVQQFAGNAPQEEMVEGNAFRSMFQQYLENENLMEVHHASQQTEPIKPIAELNRTPMQQRAADTRSFVNKIRSTTGDGITSAISKTKDTIVNAPEKMSQLIDKVKNMGPKKAMMIGGALALGGIAGYNILSSDAPEMHYKEEQKERQPRKEQPREEQPQEYQQQDVQPRERQDAAPAPAIDMPESQSQQNASISVRASGKGADKDQMSQAVSQGMRDAGMNAGPTRISVSHTDNTQKLNRVWYRDKVQENI